MTPDQGQILLRQAREGLHAAVGSPLPVEPQPDWLREPGATFVTLTRRGELRGCIGSIVPRRSIGEDVRENAAAAALRDPRFHPMERDELAEVGVEVAVLSPLEPLLVAGQADAWAKLRPGVDGVVLSWGANKGTFLPQMWEQLPTPAEFLRYLNQKAGLPGDFWDASVTLQRFTVQKWR